MGEQASEVVITQEMIEAGVLELCGFSPSIDELHETVRAIFLAMIIQCQKPDREG